MKKILNNTYKLINNNYYNQALVLLILLSTFLLPVFRFSTTMPYIDVVDLILPLLLLSYLVQSENIRSKYALLIFAFCVYILLTMAINSRLKCYRDYFELLKLVKFLLVFVLIFQRIKLKSFQNYIVIFFIGVVIFNMIHYFNIFDFNVFLGKYYFKTDVHISLFGLNSIGEATTKRMLGTLGNPNNNAVFFLFFTSYFLMNHKKNSLSNNLLYIIAFTGVILCQSRTGIISFLVIYILHFFIAPFDVKSKLYQLLIMLAIFFIVFEFNSSNYVASLATGHEIIESGSAKGRLETWTHLWEMIKDKPLLGHAPFKEYFYDNQLYSESEYVLMAWRYGFVGLFIYLSMLIYPMAIAVLKYPKNSMSHVLILFTTVLLITALTNNPISNPTINITFAILLGFWAKSVSQKELIFSKI